MKTSDDKLVNIINNKTCQAYSSIYNGDETAGAPITQ